MARRLRTASTPRRRLSRAAASDGARRTITILRNRFASDDKTEGYRKDGSVSVAKFEIGEGDDAGLREARMLRQREVCDVIERLLTRIETHGLS